MSHRVSLRVVKPVFSGISRGVNHVEYLRVSLCTGEFGSEIGSKNPGQMERARRRNNRQQFREAVGVVTGVVASKLMANLEGKKAAAPRSSKEKT